MYVASLVSFEEYQLRSKMWTKSGELKHTTSLVHIALHIRDTVRHANVGRPCLQLLGTCQTLRKPKNIVVIRFSGEII